MAKLRVLVVEDSTTIRRRLCEVITADPEMEVVGEAEDGQRAIELCRALRPDVVTLDMILPVMSGLAATEYMMAYCPTPILVVSSSTNRGELFKTYDALAAGAVDVLEKPRGDEPEGVWEETFIATVKLVARIRVITHPRARLGTRATGDPGGGNATSPQPSFAVAGSARGYKVAGIGASTGGPAAIVEVLRVLPPDFSLVLILVLHIGEPFGSAFAEWLDGQTARRVAYPRDGEPVGSQPGRVTMAPPGYHLLVRDGRFRLTRDPERHSCRPSVDVLFESLAREYGSAVVGCLLTGMGRDGAAGLLEIRRAGGLCLAQDEATSVVYGMPREAVLMGATEHVLPLGAIAPALIAADAAGRGTTP